MAYRGRKINPSTSPTGISSHDGTRVLAGSTHVSAWHTETGELLQTIVSRCQILRFAPLSDDELKLFLKAHPEADDSPALLGWSEGALERAETLLAEKIGRAHV